ncbi:MAG: ABC transporter substrate-binding protein [Bacteroidales bacterium]|nr:ABC transporter substrate-binding protein [Bacteroidales bacterium]
MKKILLFSIIALFVLSSLPLATKAVAQNRDHILKVYNWADYLDMDLIEEFEAWYKEQTGEDVKVRYSTFDINENMLTQIEVGHEDYDVVCPSEYIIERMLRRGLLQKIDTTDFVKTHTPNWMNHVAPFVAEKFQQMAPADDDKFNLVNPSLRVSDYAVGYMSGTTGFLYNTDFVEPEEVESWTALWNEKFQQKIYVKDAFRDVYSVLIQLARQDDILSGKTTRDFEASNLSDENIQAVEDILIKARPQIAGWEADFGKERMTQGKAWINLTWSGDAAWAIDEAAEVGCNLEYVVPKEGTNCWFDGWVIPIYAKNVRAASYWINFLCQSEVAIRNMDETGYVSVIGTPEVLEGMSSEEDYDYTVDASYFFGDISFPSVDPETGDTTWIDSKAAHLNHVLYPNIDVIERSILMHDTADRNEAMLEMWSHVKGNNLNWKMLTFILIVIALILILLINKKTRQWRKRRRRQALKKRRTPAPS